MNHPDELELADFVDGALSDEEREQVERHLTTCEACAEDVRLARAGRTMAMSLPPIEAPEQIGRPAIEERTGGHGAPVAHRRWERPLAALAAAAVIITVAVAVPKLMSSQNDKGLAAAGGSPITDSATIPPVEVGGAETADRVDHQNVNYDAGTLGGLATRELDRKSQPVPDAGDSSTAGVPACVFADPPPGARLLRIIDARFAGAPAWILVYGDGPSAADADHVVVRALSRHTCEQLATAAAP